MALSRSFLFQAGALLITVVLVHAFYVGVVRPQANQALQAQHEAMATDPEAASERSIWIIIRDPEQEICFILLIWALTLLAQKTRLAIRERAVLDRDLVPIETGESILPEDARNYARAVEALPEPERESLYARCLHGALRRFGATGNLQNVSDAVAAISNAEYERMDSELALVRYVAWAIPSIGFIGTVRGIGEALSLAHQAVEGDITGVTASLGTAFNSTFVALLLSIVLMFALYQIQQFQERLVLDAQSVCDRNLIQYFKVR